MLKIFQGMLCCVIFCVYFSLIYSFQYSMFRKVLHPISSLFSLSSTQITFPTSTNTNIAVNNSPLITTPDKARVKIGGSRFILPGDYVVHEEYGIGKYKGIIMVDITPARESSTFQPCVLISYEDGEITWFQRLVETELWFFRSAESGTYELSSIIDSKKWKKKKKNVEEKSISMAMNLLKMQALRNELHRTPCIPDNERYKEFEANFPYKPTADQELCFKAIEEDMVNRTRPMDRLVCGDVGFGKTEIAVRAIYRAVLSNKQVAVLAPTRVLALQHLRVLRQRMPDVRIELLRGGGKGEAAQVKADLKSGDCQVVVGTHALLQPTVTFDHLGLLIVDEEQRFGVGHKEKLKAITSGTDVLTLSATPIPRTLQMSLSGLRDFSLVNTPPIGRQEVKVTVCQDDDIQLVKALQYEIGRGGQVFAVVPFVADVRPTSLRINKLVMEAKVVEAHGRHEDLEERIDAFSSKLGNVLVATTVIENGIDMPNVNTIIVFDSDRFGMSALYQLRGRVGRSTTQAYAYFFTNKTSVTTSAEARLTYLKTLTALGSGYDLSRRDMEMRGHGTIFGSEQSGSSDVGQDLQSNMLQNALQEIRKDLILAVPETRLTAINLVNPQGTTTTSQFSCYLHQRFSSQLPPLPTDLLAVSRWEASLVRDVLKACLPQNHKEESIEASLPTLSSEPLTSPHSTKGTIPEIRHITANVNSETIIRKRGRKPKSLQTQTAVSEINEVVFNSTMNDSLDAIKTTTAIASLATVEVVATTEIAGSTSSSTSRIGTDGSTNRSPVEEAIGNLLSSSNVADIEELRTMWSTVDYSSPSIHQSTTTTTSNSNCNQSEFSHFLNEILDRTLLRIVCRKLGIIEIIRKGYDAHLICDNMSPAKWQSLAPFIPKDMEGRVRFEDTRKSDTDLSGQRLIIIKNLFTGYNSGKLEVPPPLLKLMIPLSEQVESVLNNLIAEYNKPENLPKNNDSSTSTSNANNNSNQTSNIDLDEES